MTALPPSEAALVVRTDFSRDDVWSSILEDIFEPEEDTGLGMTAGVEVLDDPAYRDATLDDVVAAASPDYPHRYLFVVDREAVQGFRHPVLVVCLDPEEPHRRFRAVPEAVRTIDANLFVDNISFAEFVDGADEDGVYRDY